MPYSYLFKKVKEFKTKAAAEEPKANAVTEAAKAMAVSEVAKAKTTIDDDGGGGEADNSGDNILHRMIIDFTLVALLSQLMKQCKHTSGKQ